MGYGCDICGKTISFGNSIARRGKAKYLGGVGQKITGITRRKFKPNIQRIRVLVDGAPKRLHVCTGCIKAGKVTKKVG